MLAVACADETRSGPDASTAVVMPVDAAADLATLDAAVDTLIATLNIPGGVGGKLKVTFQPVY